MHNIDKSWKIIEQWLDVNAPALIDELNAPASADEISTLETYLQCHLPDDFKTSLQIHNGNKPDYYPIAGLRLASTREIVREHKWWNKQTKNRTVDLDKTERKSCPPNAIKEVNLSSSWVPFTDSNENNFLALDLAPGTAGTAGQVISFGEDEWKHPDRRRYVYSSSFRAFMSFVADLFQEGRIEVLPDSDETALQLAGSTTDGLNLLNGVEVVLPKLVAGTAITS